MPVICQFEVQVMVGCACREVRHHMRRSWICPPSGNKTSCGLVPGSSAPQSMHALGHEGGNDSTMHLHSRRMAGKQMMIRPVQELRRGVDPACVHCLAFSRGEKPDWLALSSDKVCL